MSRKPYAGEVDDRGEPTMPKAQSFAEIEAEADDLENLEAYGEDGFEKEAEGLGGVKAPTPFREGRNRRQSSYKGHDFVIEYAVGDTVHLKECWEWTDAHIARAGWTADPKVKIINSEASCPYDFEAGVWIEVQCNTRADATGDDNGLKERVESYDEMLERMEQFAKLPEARWVLKKQGRLPNGHGKPQAQPSPVTEVKQHVQEGSRPATVSIFEPEPDTPAPSADGFYVEGERYRDIFWLKRVKEPRASDPEKFNEYWVPYYEDDKGDPHSIGSIWTWNKPDEPQIATQLREIVGTENRRNPKLTKLEVDERFRIFYVVPDGVRYSVHHRIERLEGE